MRLSARNQLRGTVVGIDEGAFNGIVKIDIGGDNVVRELGLEVDKPAIAVIKATSVMVAVD